MKEEGFVTQALEKATRDDGRWVANQAHFNGLDSDTIQETVKAGVITSLDIYNHDPLANQLDAHIERAIAATTQGEVRAIIAEVDEMLKEVSQ